MCGPCLGDIGKALRRHVAWLAMLALLLPVLTGAGSAAAQDQLLTYFKTSDNAAIQEMRLKSYSILDYQMDLFDNGKNPFNYVAVEFSVQKTGVYLFGQNEAPLDTVMLLYKGSFNPNSVKTNLVAANDDWYRFRPISQPNVNSMGTLYVTGSPADTCDTQLLNCLRLPETTLVLKNCGTKARLCPGMYSTLEANEKYYMVVTHFHSDDRLTFTLPQSFWCYGGSCTFKQAVLPPSATMQPTPLDPPELVVNPTKPDGNKDPPPPDQNNAPPADPTTTFLALLTQERGLTQLMSRKASRLVQTLENDCTSFDAQGYCISFRTRAAVGTAGEGAGVFILSARLDAGLRAGVFIDQVVTVRDPTGFSQPDERPTFGGFIAYHPHPQVGSYEFKLSAAYSPGRLISEREIVLDSQPGSGIASFTGFGLRGEVSRAVQFDGFVMTPFVALRHLQVQRGAYSESSVAGHVDAPLSFKDLRLTVASAVAGLRIEGRLDTYWGYQFSLSGEYDLMRHINEMSGTSTIKKLETFGIQRSFNKEPMRLAAMSGLFYEFAKQNRLFVQVALRGNPRQVGSVTKLVGYQISF